MAKLGVLTTILLYRDGFDNPSGHKHSVRPEAGLFPCWTGHGSHVGLNTTASGDQRLPTEIAVFAYLVCCICGIRPNVEQYLHISATCLFDCGGRVSVCGLVARSWPEKIQAIRMHIFRRILGKIN